MVEWTINGLVHLQFEFILQLQLQYLSTYLFYSLVNTIWDSYTDKYNVHWYIFQANGYRLLLQRWNSKNATATLHIVSILAALHTFLNRPVEEKTHISREFTFCHGIHQITLLILDGTASLHQILLKNLYLFFHCRKVLNFLGEKSKFD